MFSVEKERAEEEELKQTLQELETVAKVETVDRLFLQNILYSRQVFPFSKNIKKILYFIFIFLKNKTFPQTFDSNFVY